MRGLLPIRRRGCSPRSPEWLSWWWRSPFFLAPRGGGGGGLSRARSGAAAELGAGRDGAGDRSRTHGPGHRGTRRPGVARGNGRGHRDPRACARRLRRCGDHEGAATAGLSASVGQPSPGSAPPNPTTDATAPRGWTRTARRPPASTASPSTGWASRSSPTATAARSTAMRMPIARSGRCSTSRRPGATGTSTAVATVSRTRRTSTTRCSPPRTTSAAPAPPSRRRTAGAPASAHTTPRGVPRHGREVRDRVRRRGRLGRGARCSSAPRARTAGRC